MMNGKEKLYFLLDAIDDARAIAPSGQPLMIDPMNDLNDKIREVELSQLFTKLEKDEQVLKVLKVPSRIKTIDIVEDLDPYEHADDGCWHIELLPAFDNYFLKIQHKPEYQDFTGKTPSSGTTSKQQTEDEITEPVLMKSIFATPSYSTKSRQIAGQFSSENRQFVLMVLKEIIPLVDFSVDGKVHYCLQSPSGHPSLIKERLLLKKLEQQGLFKNLGEDGFYGIATLNNLDTKLIKEIIAILEERESGVITSDGLEEIKKESKNFTTETASSKGGNQPEKPEKQNTPKWQDDFEWQGKKFVFGKYGSTSVFNSKTRLTLFSELTKAEGNWVTVRKLKEITDKNEAYIRPTIGQIKRSFDRSLRNHISIPATVTDEDDLQPKPQQGAYRIRFTP